MRIFLCLGVCACLNAVDAYLDLFIYRVLQHVFNEELPLFLNFSWWDSCLLDFHASKKL